MLSFKILLCFIVLSVLRRTDGASLPILQLEKTGAVIALAKEADDETRVPVALIREGVPPPLCAGRCASPPVGPVCAFDARGTARTFATLCELEAVSCRESIYYAITSLGEC